MEALLATADIYTLSGKIIEANTPNTYICNLMGNLDAEWETFVNTGTYKRVGDEHEGPPSMQATAIAKECGALYISTTTKISFLDRTVPLVETFWRLPVIEYSCPIEGVVKKQMKFSSFTEEDLQATMDTSEKEHCVRHHLITRVDNPTGRVGFKDIRKISVGLSKKDIQNHRSKEKSAFYNCFVMILRIQENSSFKEIHVKVFNTGKLEIPGIQSVKTLNTVLRLVLDVLRPIVPDGADISFTGEHDTVLINSNFNCGFYIDRQRFYDILRNEYRLSCSYDPCSYPGVQCKYYYDCGSDDELRGRRDIVAAQYKVSFMVFRTGSVLVVGKCTEEVLSAVYERIRGMLLAERDRISDHAMQETSTPPTPHASAGGKKRLRRFIHVKAAKPS